MKKRSVYIFVILTLIGPLVFSACNAGTAAETTPTATALPTAETPRETTVPVPNGFIRYISQSGDTIPAVAAHFGVSRPFVQSPQEISESEIIDPGTELWVRDALNETSSAEQLFPDGEVVYSPSAIDFDLQEFADSQGGYLSTYAELMTRGTTPATEILQQLALEHSYHPRILLALMELESGWVTRQPNSDEEDHYPFGYIKSDRGGIYQQTGWAIRRLHYGYYEWRAGRLKELTFMDGETLRLSPYLNAGSVAVMYFLAQIHSYPEWEQRVYGEDGITAVYEGLFGDPWQNVGEWDPLFPAGILQPEMNLPFPPNQRWAHTCGPHTAWGREGPPAALDFAPPSGNAGCDNSRRYATAAAAGLVVRDGKGVIVIDLDKDGYEQTGWVLVYMHIANTGRVEAGDYLNVDDNVGHPSCEGGSSSGTHVHIARKYNGEWVLAEGGLPFVLSGYQAYNGDDFCGGTLVLDDDVVHAFPWGNALTLIARQDSDPDYLYTPTPKK